MWKSAILLGLCGLMVGCGDDTPSIHKWQGVLKETGTYIYIVRNPPKTQSGLVALIADYIKQDPDTPAGFLNDEHSIFFYKESSVTPIDGDRPKASWWEQPMTDPAITYKEIDEQRIAAARYYKDKELMTIFLRGEYQRYCPAREDSIVDIKADGTIDPLCD
ncbi:hypothetical protein HNP12_002422 [Aeromonas hydrophila]|uniref:hypothetical protein n=1 Tax=Aeromonas hydrophila TaxID=644 RepID=UPI00216902E3|nr:hypothetical protein [Aeromonas hydrophila]MCS3768348.1 hypothetical protein [Aeromonas hydrophila]